MEIAVVSGRRGPGSTGRAEVDVTLDVTAHVPHVFQSFAGGPLDEADQALDRAALFIHQHLRTPGTATAPAQDN